MDHIKNEWSLVSRRIKTITMHWRKMYNLEEGDWTEYRKRCSDCEIHPYYDRPLTGMGHYNPTGRAFTWTEARDFAPEHLNHNIRVELRCAEMKWDMTSGQGGELTREQQDEIMTVWREKEETKTQKTFETSESRKEDIKRMAAEANPDWQVTERDI